MKSLNYRQKRHHFVLRPSYIWGEWVQRILWRHPESGRSIALTNFFDSKDMIVTGIHSIVKYNISLTSLLKEDLIFSLRMSQKQMGCSRNKHISICTSQAFYAFFPFVNRKFQYARSVTKWSNHYLLISLNWWTETCLLISNIASLFWNVLFLFYCYRRKSDYMYGI